MVMDTEVVIEKAIAYAESMSFERCRVIENSHDGGIWHLTLEGFWSSKTTASSVEDDENHALFASSPFVILVTITPDGEITHVMIDPKIA